MTTEILDQLFRSRYGPAIRLCRRIQIGYICLALLFSIICFTLRIRIWWGFPLIIGGYFVLNQLLFNKWKATAIRDRIMLASETVSATVTAADSFLGIHQVAYRYQWKSWNFSASDMVAASEIGSYQTDRKIDICLDPLRPKQSYIIPLPERLAG